MRRNFFVVRRRHGFSLRSLHASTNAGQKGSAHGCGDWGLVVGKSSGAAASEKPQNLKRRGSALPTPSLHLHLVFVAQSFVFRNSAASRLFLQSSELSSVSYLDGDCISTTARSLSGSRVLGGVGTARSFA